MVKAKQRHFAALSVGCQIARELAGPCHQPNILRRRISEPPNGRRCLAERMSCLKLIFVTIGIIQCLPSQRYRRRQIVLLKYQAGEPRRRGCQNQWRDYMMCMRTRIIASAFVFAANFALSLSCGTAEAQSPHRGAIQMSHRHHVVLADPAAGPAEAASLMMKPETSMHPSDYSGFCGFSGVNAC